MTAFRPGRKILNLSMSVQTDGGTSGAISSAITTLVDGHNILVVTAAGNAGSGGDNAFWYTPGNAARSINVGASSQSADAKWAYSNYGYNIVFYAPGQFIEAASDKIPQVDSSVTREYYRSELSDCALVV